MLDESSPRHGQDGADSLQEASVGVILELALFGPGAAVLRVQSRVLEALRTLTHVGATKLSREHAASALFELEQDKRAKPEDDGSGTGLSMNQNKLPPHVMMSYNWDHQNTILRVVVTLQARGYLVWVDTEQMKGSTVDTMALAVEGSEVMLVGVSRAYKESSNCRMEAQYGLQKKKPLIPLMIVKGYEADGWLGLLLGTSMWYAFFGEALSSEIAFGDRVDALCREIGGRGRADATVMADDTHEPESEPEAIVGASELVQELQGLKLRALSKRALSMGIDAESVEGAMDADDGKAALVGLIVEVESLRGPADRVVSCLEAGGGVCAEMLTGVLEHAMDVLEQLSVSSPRKSRKRLLETIERVESMVELVDLEWCDGVSRCGWSL